MMRRVAPAIAFCGIAAVAGAYVGLHAPGGSPGRQPPRDAARDCAPVAIGTQQPGMSWVPAGRFTMGRLGQYPEEGPERVAQVSGFWMDQTEVTNAQFAQFVAATGYRTLAERGVKLDPAGPAIAGSTVFQVPVAAAPGASVGWWRFVAGADWRHPQGPGSSITGREHYPVVHVAYEDALAYAQWKGRSLPTEEQFEYAAQSSRRRDADGHWQANTWQGSFPGVDTAGDGHAGLAPVGCYEANRLALHDLLGNVWEWTGSPYFDRHDSPDRLVHPRGHDPAQPDEPAVAVLKGGSFLCSDDYCMRYRPEARIGQSLELGSSHIGFRTVLNP